MIDENLVEKTRKIVIGLVAEPPDITAEVNDRLATAKKLEEVGFTRLSQSIKNQSQEQRLRQREAQWLHEKQEQGNIVLDLDKIKWEKEKSGDFGNRVTYQYKPTYRCGPLTAAIGLFTIACMVQAIIQPSIELLGLGLIFFVLFLAAPMIDNVLEAPNIAFLKTQTLFRFPVNAYPFNVPDSVAETLLKEKGNYSKFEVLAYARYKDVEEALPRNVDPVLLGMISSRYGVVLAIWGTDLEQLEQEIVKKKLSKEEP